MNTKKYVRSTFVLDHDTHESLAFASERMGKSRSDLVRGLISLPVQHLAMFLRDLGTEPTRADVSRVARSGVDQIKGSVRYDMDILMRLSGWDD